MVVVWGMGPFLPGSLAAPTLPRRGSELYDFDQGCACRYRRIVQEAPAAVFPSVPASKEDAVHFLSGIGEPQLGMQSGEDTLRTSEFRS